jgi:ribosomal protein S18 acetylase RimI-like enzyme
VNYSPFTRNESMQVKLADGYALKSAPEREFGINYAIYRNVNPEFEDFLEYGSDLEGLNYCFWVLKRNVKVGGIIIRPNHIEGLFVLPPRREPFEVLQAVMPVLQSWSSEERPVEAVDVMPTELGLYERLGFRIARRRRVYVRPTERFEVHWPSGYVATSPVRHDVRELAELFHASFRNYPREWELGGYDLERWTTRVAALVPDGMEEVRRQASTVMRDATRQSVVGACLVSLKASRTRPDSSYAGVSMIGVHPEHRRRGIAKMMLLNALTVLHGHRPTLKFGVAVGNPAEAFYEALGFLAGPTGHVLLMPPQPPARGDGDAAPQP